MLAKITTFVLPKLTVTRASILDKILSVLLPEHTVPTASIHVGQDTVPCNSFVNATFLVCQHAGVLCALHSSVPFSLAVLALQPAAALLLLLLRLDTFLQLLFPLAVYATLHTRTSSLSMVSNSTQPACVLLLLATAPPWNNNSWTTCGQVRWLDQVWAAPRCTTSQNGAAHTWSNSWTKCGTCAASRATTAARMLQSKQHFLYMAAGAHPALLKTARFCKKMISPASMCVDRRGEGGARLGQKAPPSIIRQSCGAGIIINSSRL